MSIESEMRTYLLTQTGLTDLINTRLYNKRAPQYLTDANYPYVVFSLTSNPRIPAEVGIEGENPVYSFRIVAKKGSDVVAISDALAVILKYSTIQLSGLYIYICTPLGSRDLNESLDMEDEGYYVRVDDYQFEYQDLPT